MNQFESAQVSLFIRKMRGGSQSFLALASDGFFYVVKSADSPQGPNIPFNEAMGSELFRLLGLSTPEWRLIEVSDSFLDQHPICWFETEHGLQRPKAGWCFGSRFVGLNDPELFEILPTPYFGRIRNRKDFWLAWVVDVLCGHSDHRQALFVESVERSIEAIFVDHGHLFRGPDGNASPLVWAPKYLNSEIYPAVGLKDADEIADALERIDLTELAKAVDNLPLEWKTHTALAAVELFTQRISCGSSLRRTVSSLIGLAGSFWRLNERRAAAPIFELDRRDLCAQVSELAFAG